MLGKVWHIFFHNFRVLFHSLIWDHLGRAYQTFLNSNYLSFTNYVYTESWRKTIFSERAEQTYFFFFHDIFSLFLIFFQIFFYFFFKYLNELPKRHAQIRANSYKEKTAIKRAQFFEREQRTRGHFFSYANYLLGKFSYFSFLL